ncbi:hypothetical protein E7744_01550 [Citricoccus sp. SGAir0253]|uniref:hypothetical protein n=1 Tax=Citricoccus sp. SGAir0253 TaxID=2567881 RepID=UPI0010CD0430|nr:hypothetical protein [Citricoccus sp. SGAir0253]QCU77051.1 hypothetical protein E7744_01550 [Citricoccus sp. SGAir0253]
MGPRAAEAPAPPSYAVRGGPASIHAELGELEWGSALLGAAAAEATALAVRAAGWEHLVALAGQQAALAAALAARTADLSAGLMSVGTEAQSLELAVGFSARSYREAEEWALGAVQRAAGGPSLGLALGLWAAGEPIPLPVTELALAGAGDLLPALLGGMGWFGLGLRLVADVPGRLARDAGRTGPLSGPERLYPLIVRLGGTAGLVQVGPVRVRSAERVAAPGSQSGEYALDGSLGGLLDHLDRGRLEAAGPGAVQVTRIAPTAPGAPERVWLVALPGTQSGDFRDASGWSTNPFDASGNGEAMALDSQHVATGVAEALRASGAQPGDTLVLSGYSQGGIHAARLAADPRIRSEYDVQGVLTVGSPTGEIALPQDVEALHLEHDEDVVPGLDGRGNPQGAHRTTVTFSGTVAGAGAGEGRAGDSTFSAHGFENYRAHVARLDAGGEAAAAAPVLAAPAADGVPSAVVDRPAPPGRPPLLGGMAVGGTASGPAGDLLSARPPADPAAPAASAVGPPAAPAAPAAPEGPSPAERLAPTTERLAALTTGAAVTRSVTLERTRPGHPRHPLEAGPDRGEARTTRSPR